MRFSRFFAGGQDDGRDEADGEGVLLHGDLVGAGAVPGVGVGGAGGRLVDRLGVCRVGHHDRRGSRASGGFFLFVGVGDVGG